MAYEKGLVPLAFAIAGHHSGLANPQQRSDSGALPLRERIDGNRGILTDLRSLLPSELLNRQIPPLPDWASPGPEALPPAKDAIRRSLEFWTRMLFSALVDADRLATERFCSPTTHASRAGTPPLEPLLDTLDRWLATLPDDTAVSHLRQSVLADCRNAAQLPPGFFSLTVPTGGGKTLSSMAFALRHATKHRLRRVIVAIPFTSIIEQNAKVYRTILGADQVIEHHSNLDEGMLAETYGEVEVARRLASDNWDAPIVVTTNVQFFESIFSNRPSRCRKIHNIARSVIILDEVQALPPGFLLPVLDALRELVSRYGCTVVLSTATQPALTQRPSLPAGLEGVHEIASDPRALARTLRRVRVVWPRPDDPPTPFTDLAEQLRAETQVLAIVHRRKDAQDLAMLLPSEGRYHLSALMCPAHRTEVLDRVKLALTSGEPCRLVSTQVVEAGVDIDFPVVFRALAGLDSLVQAAGRCNREGTLVDAGGHPVPGRFEIFRSATEPPPGILRRGLETTLGMLARHPQGLTFGDPETTEEYFRLLFGSVALDVSGIQAARAGLNFAATAEKFRLIADSTWPVVVPWGDAAPRLATHDAFPTRATFRSLQPFTVQIYDHQLRGLCEAGALTVVSDGLFALAAPFKHLYDPVFGLLDGAGAAADPTGYIT